MRYSYLSTWLPPWVALALSTICRWICSCGSTPKPAVNSSPMATSGMLMRPTKSAPWYMVASPGKSTYGLPLVRSARR